ncbi:erythropoietin isoform X5 [Phaenicophaeus curvirostris]|uniref:erythropoietin isoform X5 n=1 Tax=Phaenicophaeus curvirostris TaxID=33595 RepID=UPI0037F0F631
MGLRDIHEETKVSRWDPSVHGDPRCPGRTQGVHGDPRCPGGTEASEMGSRCPGEPWLVETPNPGGTEASEMVPRCPRGTWLVETPHPGGTEASEMGSRCPRGTWLVETPTPGGTEASEMGSRCPRGTWLVETPTPGLCALLLLLLGVPGRPEAPPLLCDPRVMERFILEARDAERGLAGCGPPCDLPEAVSVPDPGVNFNTWRGTEAGAWAQEVRGGQAVLVAAVLRAQELLPDPQLRPTLDRAYSTARSLASLLRGVPAPPPPSTERPPRLRVQTLSRLLGVQSSFLRGKVRLFVAEACGR